MSWFVIVLKRKQKENYAPSSRPGIFESGESGCAAGRSAAVVSADGTVCQRQFGSRGDRVSLGAAKGIRPAPERCSKGALSERDRLFGGRAWGAGSLVSPHR